MKSTSKNMQLPFRRYYVKLKQKICGNSKSLCSCKFYVDKLLENLGQLVTQMNVVAKYYVGRPYHGSGCLSHSWGFLVEVGFVPIPVLVEFVVVRVAMVYFFSDYVDLYPCHYHPDNASYSLIHLYPILYNPGSWRRRDITH